MLYAITMIGVYIYYTIIIIGGIWAIIRIFQYTFGAHSDEINVSPWVWIALIVGIWVPALNVIVLSYILFLCKSVGRLIKVRNLTIGSMTAGQVVESTEQYIMNQDLMHDEWVVKNWKETSSSDWIKRLSANKSLLKYILSQKVIIHARTMKLYANWLTVIKQFDYMDGREEFNNEIEEQQPEISVDTSEFVLDNNERLIKSGAVSVIKSKMNVYNRRIFITSERFVFAKFPWDKGLYFIAAISNILYLFMEAIEIDISIKISEITSIYLEKHGLTKKITILYEKNSLSFAPVKNAEEWFNLIVSSIKEIYPNAEIEKESNEKITIKNINRTLQSIGH